MVEKGKIVADMASGNSSTLTHKRRNNEPEFLGLLNDDISNMDVVELQSYVERLQAKAKQLGATQTNKTSSRYQTFYRILEDTWIPSKHSDGSEKMLGKMLSSPFFDHPELVGGQGKTWALRCKIPVNNFDLYLEQNKDISFIVYRTFVTPAADSLSNWHTNIDSSEIPEQMSQSIRPVAKDLINAFEAILQSREEYADLLQTYRETSELHSPYLFMYHNRKDLDMICNDLNQYTQEQLGLFSDYVVQNYGSLYATADSLISRGKISPEHIDFLFKPGDVLVQRHEISSEVGSLPLGRAKPPQNEYLAL